LPERKERGGKESSKSYRDTIFKKKGAEKRTTKSEEEIFDGGRRGRHLGPKKTTGKKNDAGRGWATAALASEKREGGPRRPPPLRGRKSELTLGGTKLGFSPTSETH